MIHAVQPNPSGSNPYIGLLRAALERTGQVRTTRLRGLPLLVGRRVVWHMHWPEHSVTNPLLPLSAVGAVAHLLAARVARWMGVRVVWTAHNLRSHDTPHPRLEAWFRDRLVPYVDGWISLTDAVHDAALDRWPRLGDRPSAVIPHGHYLDVYPTPPEREAARTRLGIGRSERTILLFGKIRPYKRPLDLVRAFGALDRPDVRLVVAGACTDGPLRRSLLAEAEADPRIRLRLEDIPAEDVPTYFAAADLSVIPFAQIWNSGSVILSLGFGVPVMVTDRGGMSSLAAQVGREWLMPIGETLRAADLERGLEAAGAMPPGDGPDLSAFDWVRIGQATLALYERVLRPPGEATGDP